MPALSRYKNCVHCASLAHKSDICPRLDKGTGRTAAIVTKKAAPGTETSKAAVRSETKKVRDADIAAKVATSAAAKDAARIATAKTHAAQRDRSISKRKKAAQVQAVYTAAYATLVAIPGVMVKSTPGNYRHSRWAVVSTLCAACSLPLHSVTTVADGLKECVHNKISFSSIGNNEDKNDNTNNPNNNIKVTITTAITQQVAQHAFYYAEILTYINIYFITYV